MCVVLQHLSCQREACRPLLDTPCRWRRSSVEPSCTIEMFAVSSRLGSGPPSPSPRPRPGPCIMGFRAPEPSTAAFRLWTPDQGGSYPLDPRPREICFIREPCCAGSGYPIAHPITPNKRRSPIKPPKTRRIRRQFQPPILLAESDIIGCNRV